MTRYGSFIEYKLARWLKDFDTPLYDNYLKRTKTFSNALQALPNVRQIEERTQLLGFRIEMGTPTHLVLSHEISRFKSDKKYRIFQEEQTFVTKFGQIPVYLASLNLFSVLKVWGERAKQMFSSLSRPLPDEGSAVWELNPDSGHAEYSSMNFVEVSHAEEKMVTKPLAETMRKFFVYGFWDLPERGFACSPSILHDDTSIRTILKTAKGPYALGEIHEEHFRKGHVDLNIRVVQLWGLIRNNGTYSLAPFSAWLTHDIADELANVSPENRYSIVNGVVQEFRRRSAEIRPTTLTVIGGYGVSPLELAKVFIGLITTERFHDDISLSEAGYVDELQTEFRRVCSLFKNRVGGGSRLLEETATLFTQGVQALYPVVVQDGQKLFFVHPYLMSALSKYDLETRIASDQKALISFLKLLDYQVNGAKMLNSAEARQLQSTGLPMELIIKALKDCVNGICIAKALRGCEIDLPEWSTSSNGVTLAKCGACGEYHVVNQKGKGISFCPKCGAFISQTDVYS
jgi:hypothetical protein